jgi:hypothetical protein
MKCLFNPTEEERVEREPLLKYSFYLSSKNILLLDVLDEIIEKLDTGFSEKSVNADIISDASVLTWFWTLGAYEMIRTMAQTKDCFSANINVKINVLKQVLAKARMPSSKMEKKGRKVAINSNRSFDGWDITKKDLLIGDPDSPISARELFVLYDNTLSSITKYDILKKHEQSNEYAKK